MLITLATGISHFRVSRAASDGTGHAFRVGEQGVTLQAAGRGQPFINLRDGRDVPTVFVEAGAAVREFKDNRAKPVALASGDLDEDGMPDLIGGYAGAEAGILTVHRGDVDALFPHTSETQNKHATSAARGEGLAATVDDVASPFVAEARAFSVPEAPEFLGAGDFNADGHWDVVTAARGGDALYLLAGDGTGELRAAERIAVPGKVTAFTTGEINRADGLTDVVVGITGADGAKALVFEWLDGALKGAPEVIALPDRATALAVGQLDKDYEMDLAVAAGSELLMVKGRDRKLSHGDAGRAGVPNARVSRQSFPFNIKAMVLGNFSGDRRAELVLLSEDGGTLMLKAKGEGRRAKGKKRADVWEMEALNSGVRSGAAHLVCAHVSGSAVDDLVVVDEAGRQLHIVSRGSGVSGRGSEKQGATRGDGRRMTDERIVSLDVGSAPVAVLPMRLNADALSDLVIFRGGHIAPMVVVTQPMAVFTVTNTNDEGAGSLRQAILDANASPGADAINFGSNLQTIMPENPLPTITDPVTIDGSSGGAERVELSGSGGNGGGVGNGLSITAGSSVVRRIILN